MSDLEERDVKGARIYLRRDPQPMCVGVPARMVVEALVRHPANEKFIAFASPLGLDRSNIVRVDEIVAITDAKFTITDLEDDD